MAPPGGLIIRQLTYCILWNLILCLYLLYYWYCLTCLSWTTSIKRKTIQISLCKCLLGGGSAHSDCFSSSHSIGRIAQNRSTAAVPILTWRWLCWGSLRVCGGWRPGRWQWRAWLWTRSRTLAGSGWRCIPGSPWQSAASHACKAGAGETAPSGRRLSPVLGETDVISVARRFCFSTKKMDTFSISWMFLSISGTPHHICSKTFCFIRFICYLWH